MERRSEDIFNFITGSCLAPCEVPKNYQVRAFFQNLKSIKAIIKAVIKAAIKAVSSVGDEEGGQIIQYNCNTYSNSIQHRIGVVHIGMILSQQPVETNSVQPFFLNLDLFTTEPAKLTLRAETLGRRTMHNDGAPRLDGEEGDEEAAVALGLRTGCAEGSKVSV